MTSRPPQLSRRTFFEITAATPVLGAMAPLRVPREKLRVACVGVGGMGGSDLRSVASSKRAEIVALCDVDANRLANAAKHHADAKRFRDFRKLIESGHKEIDAVVVSTPDHMHGSVALAAMRRGKHVYCQKPIAHNLYECRAMADLAEKSGVVTQMGTQIHSHGAYQSAVATLRSGVIGKVREAHLWVSKSWAGPPKVRPEKQDAVPKQLDWDLWLGVAAERPFVRGVYHPGNWRRWFDFGSGTLGDMGCHIFDPVFSALGLGAPSGAVSRSERHFEETFAPDSDVVYEFPGTKWTTDRVKLRWTDGRRKSRPDAAKAGLPEGHKLPGAGSFLVGEKGVLVIPHIAMPRVYVDGEHAPDAVVKRPNKNHYHEWVNACLGDGKASTPFSYSGPLTEAVLLGTVAGHYPGKQLAWNSAKLSFDDAKAQAHVKRAYREGWDI